jgi:hypothetical protein
MINGRNSGLPGLRWSVKKNISGQWCEERSLFMIIVNLIRYRLNKDYLCPVIYLLINQKKKKQVN